MWQWDLCPPGDTRTRKNTRPYRRFMNPAQIVSCPIDGRAVDMDGAVDQVGMFFRRIIRRWTGANRFKGASWLIGWMIAIG